jgi:signal transduction histidine kinase
MMIQSTNNQFSTVLEQLRACPTSLPWPERREVVAQLSVALAEGEHSPVVFDLVFLLAADPKWEVRSDVANLLMFLPAVRLPKIAARLSEDPNAFVRKTTARAMDRQQRAAENDKREKQGLQYMQSQYELLEKLHGKSVADKARKIAEQLFDHLVGVTVHELRGVLTPLMSGASSLLQQVDQGVFEPAAFRRQVVKMNNRLAFIGRLVEDMRSYALPPPLERRRERLFPIFQEALTMARDSVCAQGHEVTSIQLEMDVPENITLDVSRHQILVALANVVKNAYEAFFFGFKKRRQMRIRISAQVLDQEQVMILIEDNGVGMAPEDLIEVRQFIPGRTSKRNVGTGFGLPIAKRNIAAHGGNILLESKENKGTKITILLPLGVDEED